MSSEREVLLQASNRTAGKVVLYSDSVSQISSNGVPLVKIWVPSALVSDVITIMNKLPEILQDHLAMTELLPKLLGLLVEQQAEIDRISRQMEELRRAAVSVKAQDNIHDALLKLTGQGSDVEEPEIRIHLTATSNYKSESQTDKQSGRSESQLEKAHIGGEIHTLLKVLGGLNFGTDSENSKLFQQFDKFLEQRMVYGKSSYEGDVEIKFKSVSGSPIKKAEAKVIEAKAEAIKAGKLPPDDKDV